MRRREAWRKTLKELFFHSFRLSSAIFKNTNSPSSSFLAIFSSYYGAMAWLFYEPILLLNGLSILLLCNFSFLCCFLLFYMCGWFGLRCFNGIKGTAADEHKFTDEESLPGRENQPRLIHLDGYWKWLEIGFKKRLFSNRTENWELEGVNAK